MTDKDIADIYRRWFHCVSRHMKQRGKGRAMERFALENKLVYFAVVHEKYVEHFLYYGKELILRLEV